MHRLSLTPLSFLLGLSPIFAQSTWVVDTNGSGDFLELATAVLSAADGDTILVRPGTYEPVTVDGKGLWIQGQGEVIVATGNPLLPAKPALRARNLNASQSLSLRGLKFHEFSLLAEFDNRLVTLDDNAGSVVFEDCVFGAPPGTSFPYSNGIAYPLSISDCASVAMQRCTSVGPSTVTYFDPVTGFPFGPVVYQGLGVIDSRVALYDSTFLGGDGVFAMDSALGAWGPFDGGHGLALVHADVVAVGCNFEGGSALPALPQVCSAGGNGTAGMSLAAVANSTAQLLDCSVMGGFGAPGSCGLPAGFDAPDLDDSLGGAVLHPGTARRAVVPSPVVEASTFPATFEGVPGDLALLLVSPTFDLLTPIANLPQAIHVGLPTWLLVLGAVPTSGVLSTTLQVPPLPAGVLSAQRALQFAALSGFDAFDAGPSALLVIDSAL